MKKTAIIIHGGCGSYDITDQLEIQHQKDQKEGLTKAIILGWNLLQKGAAALDVVEQVINSMEDCPAFNAGIGAAIGLEGQIELDASIMDGSTNACGAIACLSGISHTISVARKVMEKTPHVFLVGNGADSFAKIQGFTKLPNSAFYTSYQQHWLEMFKNEHKIKPRKETVGAVVLDNNGHIAAGTSTGGITGKMLGRVGDSPIIGAGTYAVDGIGGASATGNGEQIIQVGLTRSVIDYMEYKKMSAQEASEQSIVSLGEIPNGLGGVICIDAKGTIGFDANEKYLPRAYMTTGMNSPIVAFAIDKQFKV